MCVCWRKKKGKKEAQEDPTDHETSTAFASGRQPKGGRRGGTRQGFPTFLWNNLQLFFLSVMGRLLCDKGKNNVEKRQEGGWKALFQWLFRAPDVAHS